MRSHSFENRFTGKLAKIDHAEIEAFLQRLIKDKGFLELIYNSLSEGVIVTSPELKVLMCNDGALNLLGIPENRRVAGRPLDEILVLPEVRRLILSIDPTTLSPIEEEVVVSTREDGRDVERHLLVQTRTLKEEEHDVRGLLLILRDVSEQRQLEAQRRHIDKLASLATLTAGVAHEIKNPLNSLSIHVQLLQKMLENEERGEGVIKASSLRDSLEIISEETQRLGGVVDEFLQAVRPTNPAMEPLDINAVCRQVAGLVRPDCEEREIKLELRLDPEIGLAQFDERQMTQAILNLVKNSMEAIAEERAKQANEARTVSAIPPESASEFRDDEASASEDGGQDAIFVRTRGFERFIAIVVEDNGPGIPEEKLKTVFEPYYTTKFHGTGLGLMNVYRIIQEHHGRIDLQSEETKGTIFTLTIPRNAPPPRKALPLFTSDDEDETLSTSPSNDAAKESN